jgi:hypothetical protein
MMKINANAWTIVLAGNWNKNILSPQWTAEHIFNVDKLNLKFEISMNLNLPPRLSSSEVSMLPSDNAVIFAPLQQTDECYQKAENFASNLLEKLPYTPMSAFGINFGFVEESPDSSLLSLFELNDKTDLNEFGCEIKECGIVRRLQMEGKVLNLTISHADAKITFDFNFHYDVRDAKNAKELLQGQTAANRILAYKILNDIYNLEVQE